MNKNFYCVIMAGGVGSRFWPLSKMAKPKQFLDILGTGRTLLQQTFDRFEKICPVENVLVVTNIDYKDLVLEQLPKINADQVLSEPMRRNTAPCIAYANYRLERLNPDARVVVAPSDHLILKEEEFIRIINQGLRFVSENNALLTLGIKPNRPETGYGYIQLNSELKLKKYPGINKVKTFTEKPDTKLANFFVESGEFFWNSGIFLWKLDAVLEAFDKHLHDVDILFREGRPAYGTNQENNFIVKAYAECKNVSIDYGVMEKADNVYVIRSDFGWSDLGTWGSLYDHRDKDKSGNAVVGNNVMVYNSTNCIVDFPDNKLVVLQGLDDYIIVESEEILLICNKKDEQNIRQIVNDVKIEKGEQYT